MVGDDAHREAVAAGPLAGERARGSGGGRRRRRRPASSTTTSGSASSSFWPTGAVEQLHLDVVGAEVAERDDGLDRARRCRGRRRASSISTWSTCTPGHAVVDARPSTRPASRRGGAAVGAERVALRGGRLVELLGVVAHHAGGGDDRAERDERALHPPHPARGAPGPAEPLVEQRHDLALEQLEERAGLDLVAALEVVDVLGRRDGPAVLAVEALVPPAVEDRAG